MTGPLQAFLEEERIFKEQMKERQRESVTEGNQHRTLRDIEAFMLRRSPGRAASTPQSGRGPSPRSSASKKSSPTSCLQQQPMRFSSPPFAESSVNSGSRRSISPTSSSSRDPHYEKPARPASSSSKMHAGGSGKRKALSPTGNMAQPEREVPKTIASNAEREKWDEFLLRISSKKQEKDKQLEMLRKKKELQDMLACTFEPEISKLGRSIKGNGTMLDRQKEMEARKAQKLKQIRQDQFDKEMAHCSFQPSLTKRTRSVDGGGTPSSRISSRNSSLRRGYNCRRLERNEEYLDESRLVSMHQIESTEGMQRLFDKVNELIRSRQGNKYWDSDVSPIHHVENNEEAFEATLLPYRNPDRAKQDVDEDSLSGTTIMGDHEDANESQFDASLSTTNASARQSTFSADSEFKIASLTSQSPGVQGFAAAIRRSSIERRSQEFSFSESPPINDSAENGASPASAPLSHGLLRRASLREQLQPVDSVPESIENSSEASDADFA